MPSSPSPAEADSRLSWRDLLETLAQAAALGVLVFATVALLMNSG